MYSYHRYVCKNKFLLFPEIQKNYTTSKNSKSPVLQLVENIRTEKGPRQLLVVSLGTYLKIPKEKRREVAYGFSAIFAKMLTI